MEQDINKLRTELQQLMLRYHNVMAMIRIYPSLKPKYAQELTRIDLQVERVTYLIRLVT